MWTNLAGFKVVYKERVYRTLALTSIDFKNNIMPKVGEINVPKAIEVIVINEDGNVMSIYDEAWMFQFIPIVGKEENRA